MHEQGLAQCLAHRKCTKTLAIIISTMSQKEKVSAKCNKISDTLERGVAMASTVQNNLRFLRVSVKIMHTWTLDDKVYIFVIYKAGVETQCFKSIDANLRSAY